MERQLYIKYLRVLLIIILVCTIIILAIKNTKNDDNQHNFITHHYKIVDLKDSINGCVIEKNNSHGALLIKLENEKGYIINHSRNYNYSPCFLNDFVIEGDSLYKSPYSDSLFVYRHDELYVFIIGEYINRY